MDNKSQSHLKINLALVQNFTKDHIERGENKGQTLNHYFTVRDFQSFSINDGHKYNLFKYSGRSSTIRLFRDCIFTKSPNRSYCRGNRFRHSIVIGNPSGN